MILATVRFLTALGSVSERDDMDKDFVLVAQCCPPQYITKLEQR